MKEKLKSRKFWIAVLSEIVSVTVIFRQIGGNIGIIAGIVGAIVSSIVYIITECKLDIERCKVTYEEVKLLIEELKSKGVDDGKGSTSN